MSSSTLPSSPRCQAPPRATITGNKLLRSVFACVYCLVFAEVFLRFLSPMPILPRYVCATPYGIRGNEPNCDYWQKTPECKVHFHINSAGMRADREFGYNKPAGVKRIVVLGDSFGMGYEVSLEESLTGQLERRLKERGFNTEVLDLSVSGHGTAEELITLREQGFRYAPDVVVLAWHVTDFDDNVRSNLYAIENGALVRRAASYLPGTQAQQRLFRYWLYRTVAENSHTYAFIRERTAELAKTLLAGVRRAAAGSAAKRKGGEQEGSPQSAAEHAGPAQPAYTMTLMMALLREMQTECQTHNADMVVLSIPTRLSRTSFRDDFPSQGLGSGACAVYSPIGEMDKFKGQLLFREQGHFHFTPLTWELVGKGLADVIGKTVHFSEGARAGIR